jgi:cytochrome c biogenesis protein
MNGKRQEVIEPQAAAAQRPLMPEDFWDDIVAFFASIKLAMFLFLMLAMTATIGTVIQQNERADVYIKEYGEQAYWWFKKLGFIDVYHTWWFTSLLGLLCINSLTCFYKRFPAVWRSMQQDKVSVSLPFITGMKHHVEVPVAATQERVGEGLAQMLAEKGYRVLARKDGGELTIYGTKGIMGRVGAHMAHLSATVIVLGGLIGSVGGYSDFGVCVEGQTYRVAVQKSLWKMPLWSTDFDLHVDKFWIDYHENGSIKSYNSTLTVFEHGAPQITKTITVNDPLVYNGIWFYQSSYGDAWNEVQMARIDVIDKATDKVVGTVDLDWKKETDVPKLGLKLAMTDFVADFGFNSAEKKVYSKTVEHANPAIKLAITEQPAVRASPWIFYHYPDLFEIPGSKYRFQLVGYQPKKFTGLQITKDPGVNIVWIGSTMIVVGITLSSFIYHRRLWAKVVPSASGVTVHLGGNTHKSQIDFQKEFRKLTEKIAALGSRPPAHEERGRPA